MIKAHEIQGVVALENDLDRMLLVRVASAAVATHALGGSNEQVIDAVSQAWLDGSARLTDHRVPDNGWRPRWATADATSRGVRHALMTVTRGMGSPSVRSAATPGPWDALFEGKSVGLAAGLGSRMMERLPLPALAEQLREFEASVAMHFPPVQAAKITAMFADRARLEATPVHEFVSVMVRA
jgi:2-methylcitrate dehydratase